MRPVVTPAEMAAIDAEAPESIEELIARAGWTTARAALAMLTRPYGSRVIVLAGKGNNGADGRAAVPHLVRAGVHVTVVDVGSDDPGPGRASAARPERPDLVVDACYGTGLRRPFDAADLPIDVGDTPVLAIDIPSGIDGATGQLRDRPLPATTTLTFAAAKPGLLLSPGRELVGRLVVADIGLDCSRATIHHLEPADLDRWPGRAVDDHKWRRAVAVVGGGPGMTGAPRLSASGALRAGAGYATLSIPGLDGADSGPGAGPGDPIEAVGRPAGVEWAHDLAGLADRIGAAVVGPGLAETATNREQVARWWARSTVPTVFDAGALAALAALGPVAPVGPEAEPAEGDGLPRPGATHVLTPHDGEFARLTGRRPGPDRVAEARALAAQRGAVVLLKGPTTIVADPAGSVLLSTAGDARLATAGTGDVLAGIVAAGLAGGLDPLSAAGLGAELHGRAAATGRAVGLVASDLPELVADLLSGLARTGRG